MKVLITKGTEQLSLLASQIYLTTLNKSLEEVINGLTFDVGVSKSYPNIRIVDDEVSSENTYSSQKIEELNLALKTLISTAEDNLYAYINGNIYQIPEVDSIQLSQTDQIEITLTEGLTNTDLTSSLTNFSVKIQNVSQTISSIGQPAGTSINLSNFANDTLEVKNDNLQLKGW